jgi:hypothetical protein
MDWLDFVVVRFVGAVNIKYHQNGLLPWVNEKELS